MSGIVNTLHSFMAWTGTTLFFRFSYTWYANKRTGWLKQKGMLRKKSGRILEELKFSAI